MLKKTIKYTDYNGVERAEDYWFNLSKTELTEWELSATGGLAETIKRITATQDNAAIIQIFKELILKAYGEKSIDGKAFVKEDENGRPLANKFKYTEAYNVLFMELATNAEAAAEFVNGLIPADLAKQLEETKSN